ncbi:MAG: hypothetical protein JNK82_04800 [Myxococcaceae bacterium]|nr:hypothetical protein [Myxococcaceae bacterium]
MHADAAVEAEWLESPPTPCERCGTFLTGAHTLCDPCATVANHGDRTREAMNVAWKLALAPGFIVLASFSRLLHQREVPLVFAVWLAPLVLAFATAKTERASVAWLGVLTSLGLLAWFALGVAYAGAHERLVDVVWLSIAPLVALPGCVRLWRAGSRVRLG